MKNKNLSQLLSKKKYLALSLYYLLEIYKDTESIESVMQIITEPLNRSTQINVLFSFYKV